ncbi:MAG: hypothetical protein ACT4R6_10670, partial [Gemmatimonadaceae bacterium]
MSSKATQAKRNLSRRDALAATATALGAAALGVAIDDGSALGAQAIAPAASPPPLPLDPTKAPGPPTSAASVRAAAVQMARAPTGAIAGASLAPIHLFSGTITPTDLHFERHHAGVALIDPARYK